MKRILDILSSMRVAIILIIIVATLSVIGAFIPQERTEGFYVEKYGSSAGELIHHLMFDRIFKSFYFIALILLLSASIIVCIIKQLPHLIRNLQNPKVIPDESDIEGKRYYRDLKNIVDEEVVRRALGSHGYKVYSKSAGERTYISARKGIWYNIGFILAHIGILVILVGGTFGGCARKSYRFILFEGGSAVLSSVGGDELIIRADNIEKMKDPNTGAIISYITDVTLFKGSEEVVSKRIEVNSPLEYGGISIYQDSMGSLNGLGVAFMRADNIAGLKQMLEFFVVVRVNDVKSEISGGLGDTVVIGDNISIVFDDFYDHYRRIGSQDRNDNSIPNPCLVYTIIDREKGIFRGYSFMYYPSYNYGGTPYSVWFIGVKPKDERVHLLASDTPFPLADGNVGALKMVKTGEGEVIVRLVIDGASNGVFELFDGCPVEVGDNLYALLVGTKRAQYTGLRVEKDPGLFFFVSGAVLLCLGILLMVSINPRHIEVLITSKRALIGAMAKRAGEEFEREFRNVVLDITSSGEGE